MRTPWPGAWDTVHGTRLMGQTEQGSRNGGEKASSQKTPALPETPASPAEHLGVTGEQGGP